MSPRGVLLAAPVLLGLALAGGLGRLGWVGPPLQGVVWHGPLLTVGLFGVVIGAERAVATGGGWRWLAPWGSLAGALGLLVGHPRQAMVLGAVGAAVLTAANTELSWRFPARHHAWLVAASSLQLLAWIQGGATGSPSAMTQAGIGSLLLTILAERLELSRLMPRPAWAAPLFDALAVAAVVGSLFSAFGPGARALAGLAEISLGLWLLRFDVVRATWRRPGQPGFTAACLGAGYVWLAVAGSLKAFAPWAAADAALHAVTLGFVLSMVFGHAPLILPAVARLPVRAGPGLWAPLVLLHVSVALRVGAGLGVLDSSWRWTSAMLTLAALIGYALLLVASLRFALRRLWERTHRIGSEPPVSAVRSPDARPSP